MKSLSSSERELVKVVLLAGLVTLFLCLIFRNRWPEKDDLLPELFQEPVQEKKDIPAPFEVVAKGYRYTVYPLFNYELWGMVVSSHNADSFLDVAHKLWKDELNIKDFCVLWGRNLETDAFRQMKFWNRDFTCYYSWSQPEAGELFSASHISNNHLITENPVLRRVIKSAKRGDQIHFQGWLSAYGHTGSTAVRGTSVTRHDVGGHACETVYVTEFEILKRANTGWRTALPVSLALISGCLALLLFF